MSCKCGKSMIPNLNGGVMRGEPRHRYHWTLLCCASGCGYTEPVATSHDVEERDPGHHSRSVASSIEFDRSKVVNW